MENKTKYVLPFWGSEAFTRLSTSEHADKWYFRKAQIGNLAPSCHLPFSAFSVVPYSGGYPTGYGPYNPNSRGTPSKFLWKKYVFGFTHFSQSGTGDIGNFYNYFLIKFPKSPVVEESAEPAFYRVKTKKFQAAATVSHYCAAYKINLFDKKELHVYPGYGGLKNYGKKPVFSPFTSHEQNEIFLFDVDYGTVKIFWALKTDGEGVISDKSLTVKSQSGNIDMLLAYSLKDREDAVKNLSSLSFSEMKAAGEAEWEKRLSRVDVKADPDTEKLFYTSLYNALKKPCVIPGPTGFCTLWDQYKTLLPLDFLLYPELSERLLEGLYTAFDGNRFMNAVMLQKDKATDFNAQAVCLAPIIYATAYKYGIKGDYKKYFAACKTEIEGFSKNNSVILPRITHNLDYSDAVNALSEITSLPAKYTEISERRIAEISDKNGLLYNRAGYEFYEGCSKNYSFRVSSSTFKRLSKASREELLLELDKFFGINGERVTARKLKGARIDAYADKMKRFEGLNNEPDMEAPYLYHLLGEYDKCSEIIAEAAKRNFHTGNGGLCGNDDSGGLTSWYVWNALGLFPVAGTDLILIGSPLVSSATLWLKGKLSIVTVNRDAGSTVNRVTLNGRELPARQISVGNLSKGGLLEIYYD